ncbi:MAG: glycosyltransferase [bacterium]|nr:glycosyltransferase [bacterium]
MENKYVYILALAAHGKGISGSDRIFIEFARHWSADYPVEIFVWEEGYEMCKRQGLQVAGITYQVSGMKPWKHLGLMINYLARIVEGVKIGFILNIKDPENTIVYSASEFWMDSLLAFILKLRYKNIKWVAAWFQTAPNPLIGFSEGKREKRYRLKSLIYFLIQFPIKFLINNFADFVLINNEEEKKQFPGLDKNGKTIVVLGAVNIKEIEKWKIKLRKQPKLYDAVFQGRFHPQKGAVELIDIWKLVVMQKKDAKLVMIGDGPLMKDVKKKIKNLNLEENIILKGFLFDGEEKYKIFSQSKLVVHPAFYDSGGMASAEAMAFGLPCVGFNLKSYKSYYPKGMEKVKIGDLDSFVDKIVELLSKEKLYKRISKEAIQMINYKWSWEYKSREILKQVIE